jgi:APA family basic amino acid/polyamine antiporter
MPEPTQLRREIGLLDAIAVTVGGVIGSGIFFKPWGIAQSLPGPAWVYLVWAALGVICLFGTFAYAELGCLFPEAGGQYAFLREGYGSLVAFLYGWCFCLVINTGTIAALAAIFADTWADLFGWVRQGDGDYGFRRDAVAAGMVLVLAIVNHVGVRWGAWVQTVSTVAKMLALGSILGAGFFRGPHAAVGAPTGPEPVAPGLIAGLVSACVAIFWAYEGWHQLPFSAAELKQPRRDLPRGLVWGTGIVILVYLAMNAVYFHVVPFAEMRRLTADVEVPRLVIRRIFGDAASSLLAGFLCLSVFGAANPSLLSSPRALYAMGQDGLLPRWFTQVHRRWQTPVAAIWVQTIWSIVLLFGMRTFKDLTVYVIFAALIFYAMTVGSVYVIRWRRPERERPYRCWGYPVTPALFILVALCVDAATLANASEQRNALVGLGILAGGVPVYVWIKRKRGGPALPEIPGGRPATR